MSNSLYPDQAQQFVGPDLGPNCLQRLSADDTSSVVKGGYHWSTCLSPPIVLSISSKSTNLKEKVNHIDPAQATPVVPVCLKTRSYSYQVK